MRAIGQADRGRGPRHFLHRDAVLEIAEAAAAVFFLDGDAVQAERADLGPEIPGELVAAVDFGGARRDFVLRERIYRLAYSVRSLAEIEVEKQRSVRGHHFPLSFLELNDHTFF